MCLVFALQTPSTLQTHAEIALLYPMLFSCSGVNISLCRVQSGSPSPWHFPVFTVCTPSVNPCLFYSSISNKPVAKARKYHFTSFTEGKTVGRKLWPSLLLTDSVSLWVPKFRIKATLKEMGVKEREREKITVIDWSGKNKPNLIWNLACLCVMPAQKFISWIHSRSSPGLFEMQPNPAQDLARLLWNCTNLPWTT